MPVSDLPPWPRRPRTLAGAWDAIADTQEVVDRMLDQQVIADAVAAALVKQRSKWLTSGRGLVVMVFSAISAAAIIATAIHSWLH